MIPAEKAKRTLLGIDIPRDELALRLAQVACQIRAPKGMDATTALAELDQRCALVGVQPMAESFRRQADAAVIYFHERINAARQPS